MTEPVLYFAYGSNMCSDVLRGRRGLRPTAVEAATLPGHRLTFDLMGIPWIEPAFASVRVDPESTVHGVLYALTDDAMRRLDRMEASSYRREPKRVIGAVRGEAEAQIYVNRRPGAGAMPSRRYLELLQRGAREHGLPEPWCAMLEAHPSGDAVWLRPIAALGLAVLGWRERAARERAAPDRSRFLRS